VAGAWPEGIGESSVSGIHSELAYVVKLGWLLNLYHRLIDCQYRFIGNIE
jgi:hypothetical protein